MRVERDQQFCVKTEEGYVCHWATDNPGEMQAELPPPMRTVMAICGQTFDEASCRDPYSIWNPAEVMRGESNTRMILCNGCAQKTLRD